MKGEKNIKNESTQVTLGGLCTYNVQCLLVFKDCNNANRCESNNRKKNEENGNNNDTEN